MIFIFEIYHSCGTVARYYRVVVSTSPMDAVGRSLFELQAAPQWAPLSAMQVATALRALVPALNVPKVSLATAIVPLRGATIESGIRFTMGLGWAGVDVLS